MQATILVTGASGFIGSKVVRHLFTHGFNVQAWGRRKVLPTDHLPKEVVYRSFDLNEPIPPIGFTWVIHCAGLASHTASEKALHDTNVVATQNILEACSENTSFVFISSGSVYPATDAIFRESDAEDISNIPDYGRTKLQAEKVCLQYENKIKNLFILRPRAVYGPGDNQLLPRLKNLVKGSYFLLPGDGKNQISMCHVDNLCDAIEKIIHSKLVGSFVWNVCDKQSYELANILKPLMETELAKPLKMVYLHKGPLLAWAHFAELMGIKSNINIQTLQYMTKSVRLDCSKIRKELGFEPEKTFWDYINQKT
ncbi:MAG: NAD(P)-dependent oxidoreductase [Saprospiraceae bacterium]|nr:NAD(P)-dependent oxidoreductase [Saprospiraceae bacterium]